MKKRRIIIITVALLLLFAFSIYLFIVVFYLPNHQIPMEVVQENQKKETTFATKDDIQTKLLPIALKEIIAEVEDFNQIEINNNEKRKSFSEYLFIQAGYEPLTSNTGDVFAIKQGLSNKYIAVGAHYDKVEGPSDGLLDNMLGCILVSDIAEVYKDEKTYYSYLFITYTDEEIGCKIGSAISGCRSEKDWKAIYVIEIDYIGDRNGGLGGRWLSPVNGGFHKTGIKITTYPIPEIPTIHTERDNIRNVDFNKLYLAYKTIISMIEKIEDGNDLAPPDTVNFWRKDKPLYGD
jgi:hypothetical protein